MAAASAILSGRAKDVALEGQLRRAGAITLMLQHDERLAQLERAVFVGEPLNEDDSRVDRCPHCGGAIRVTTVSFEAVPEGGE
jgi:hypothetical protein